MPIRVLIIPILSFLIVSCGAAAPAPEPTSAPTEPLGFQSLPAPTSMPPATETSAPSPTSTEIPVTPTETPLPTLVLPTEAINPPQQLAWDGTPTYLGDSLPGFAFRVLYDPEVWALTTDQFGFPALAHREIPTCIITPAAGHGLPPDLTVEHEFLRTDTLTFDVSTVFENGVKKFVTYTGGDATVITGFQVIFDEQGDECLADALAVITTLQSVPISQATPVP